MCETVQKHVAATSCPSLPPSLVRGSNAVWGHNASQIANGNSLLVMFTAGGRGAEPVPTGQSVSSNTRRAFDADTSDVGDVNCVIERRRGAWRSACAPPPSVSPPLPSFHLSSAVLQLMCHHLFSRSGSVRVFPLTQQLQMNRAPHSAAASEGACEMYPQFYPHTLPLCEID
ncbi:unnamed protein product [Pleuronectes platessa]|uniref:Uncharacterized protein n=1 Tax=Pleuronectes platessa TaxID=8262 RepID=A0A9N7U9C6_PLEPL|nr:unnamed protein product [Pleuronectes platessa]